MEDKVEKYLGEMKLVFSGLHLKDNILDEITVEELQEVLTSNVPVEKLNVRTATKEFENLLKFKIKDARFIIKGVVPELVKDIISSKE